MRKWIAKSRSIIDYYIKNNDSGFDLSFGSDNMIAGVEFNDKIENNLKNHEKIHFMHNHDNISEMMGKPFQQYLFNCSIYKIWYLLMECYKGKEGC